LFSIRSLPNSSGYFSLISNGRGITLPLKVSTIKTGSPLVRTYTTFSNWPGRLVGSNMARINPESPGAISVFVHSGSVQPHDGLTSVNRKGWLPRFTTLYSVCTLPKISSISPKSWSVFIKKAFGWAISKSPQARAAQVVNSFFTIIVLFFTNIIPVV
jgi:hypothetical protein